MIKNPYIYTGPLDPINDSSVCVPRTDQINQVIRGMKWGDYWAIIGPRQFGKSTFLRQLQNKYKDPCYIYINAQIIPEKESEFYQWLANELLNGINRKLIHTVEKKRINTPQQFLKFLEGLKLKNSKKKIALLFDEIEVIPAIKNFLHVWRKLFHQRLTKKEFGKYIIIITGSVDLIKETIGETSPFNIAHSLYLTDFSHFETELIIEGPLKNLNIRIEENAKNRLISETSGHPQLLQHLCHLLLEKLPEQDTTIQEKNIENTIKELLSLSNNLDMLRQQLKNNEKLKNLTHMILYGEKVRYFPYKEYSYEQAGPIIESRDGFCVFRNSIYKKIIEEFSSNSIPLRNNPAENEKNSAKISQKKMKPMIFISYSHKDRDWKNELLLFLNPLKLMGVIIWEDEKIGTGEIWKKEIIEKLNDSDIAVFLVSKYSLASEFICKEEIPYILKRCEEKKMKFFPILISQCGWELVPCLKNVQIKQLENKEPLAKLTELERDDVFTKIISEIAKILNIYENQEIEITEKPIITNVATEKDEQCQ